MYNKLHLLIALTENRCWTKNVSIQAMSTEATRITRCKIKFNNFIATLHV